MLCVSADILYFRSHLLLPDDDFYNLTLHRDSVVRIAVFLFAISLPNSGVLWNYCNYIVWNGFCGFCSLIGKFFLLYVHTLTIE